MTESKEFRQSAAHAVMQAAEYGFQIGVAENLTADIGLIVEKAVRSAVVSTLEFASRLSVKGVDLDDLATWVSEEEDVL